MSEEEAQPDQKYYQRFGKKVRYEDIADLAEAYRDYLDGREAQYVVGSHVKRINSEGEEI